MKTQHALAALCSTTLLMGAQASAQTVFAVSSWLPPTHTLSVVQKEWCDLLEKESTGRMKCNILPKGVVAAPGTFDAVRDGLADISYTVDGYTPGVSSTPRSPSSRSWATAPPPPRWPTSASTTSTLHHWASTAV